MKALIIISLSLLFVSRYATGENHAADERRNDRTGAHVPQTVAENRFSVTRPLGYYGNRLGNDFLADLAALRADGHWLDGGSGEGIAAEHYHQLGFNDEATRFSSGEGLKSLQTIAGLAPNQRAHVTALTYHMVRKGSRPYNQRLRHMVGRLMEDIPDGEIGRSDLISDVYGVFAYSNRLDQAMNKYLTSLKPSGKLYIYTAQIQRSTIEKPDGTKISLIEWLKSISGIRVEERPGSIRITKTGGDIKIPRLTFVRDDHQTPPAREFKLEGDEISVQSMAHVAGPATDFRVPHRHTVPDFSPTLEDEVKDLVTRSLGYQDFSR